MSVDGEGILIQACCGGSLVNGLTVSNNTVGSYIGLFWCGDINAVTITNNCVNDATGGHGIYVYADTSTSTDGSGYYKVNNTVIQGNTSTGTSDRRAPHGERQLDREQREPDRHLAHRSPTCACSVTVSGNTGFTVNACNNAAFR